MGKDVVVAVGVWLAMSSAVAQAQEGAPIAPAEVPRFQLALPQLRTTDAQVDSGSAPRLRSVDPETDLAVYAGLADFGMRLAGGSLALLGGAAASLGVWVSFSGTPSVGLGFVLVGALVATAAIAGAPVAEAFVVRAIGRSRGRARELAPLMWSAYLSSALVDAVTIGVAVTGAGNAALVTYLVGSALGATTMSLVQDAHKAPLAVAASDWGTADRGPAVPTSAPSGASFAF